MDAPRVYQLLLAPVSGMPIPSQEIGNAPEVVARARKTLLHTDICVGVPKQRVIVSMSTTFDRKPHSSDGRIQEIWDEKTQEATRKMFDHSKFRLHALGWTSAEGQSVGSCESTRSCLRIELGLTGYKEYIGTNRRPADDFSMLENAGRDSFADARAHFSNALGVEALLITIDKTVVLLRRSDAVATNSGEFNGPSGHPEPSAAGISAHCSASASEDQRSMVDAAALNEIYDAVLQEIVEETNVPKSTLSEPLLIGAMEDATHKPDLLFFVQTKLDAEGVRAAMASGAAESWESDNVCFFPLSEMETCSLPLTAVTRAAFHCFLEINKDGMD